MLLEQLTGEMHSSDHEHEYLSVLDHENVLGWVMSVAGFSNADGGTLFIGVDPQTHLLIGFERDEAHAQRELFNRKVDELLTPRPFCKSSFMRYDEDGTARFILRVEISQSPARPVIVDYRSLPFIFMRRENYTGGATYEEIVNMSVSSYHAAYDTLPSEEAYTSDHFRALYAFCAKNSGDNPLSDADLAVLGFFDENKMLTNGARLFEDGYDGDKTALQCTLYSGLTKDSERIVTVNHFKGNMTDAIDYACSFVVQRMNHSIIRKNDTHMELDAYPRQALMTAIVQAFARRNYFLDRTQICVDMFRDRLEISSPGGFFQDGPVRRTYDLADVSPRPRNTLICSVLARCGVMEAATGSGAAIFRNIIAAYQDADELHRPYLSDLSDHFTLVLPDLTYAAGLADSRIPAVEFVPLQKGSEYDEKILSYCCNTPRKTADIAKYLGISDSTYLRKGILGNLVTYGYLRTERANRATYYRTSFEMVRII